MSPDIAVGTLVLGYLLLVIIGASALTGSVLGRYVKAIPDAYRFPLGFGIFPVLVTALAFAGLWRIPFLTEAAGFLCACAAIVFLFRRCRGMTKQRLRAIIPLYALPCAVTLILLWAKWEYLRAGSSFSDELRSVAFVGTFANNALKPGYLFDVNMPVAYPFYVFQVGAFAYRAVAGYLYPTIALLAATLVAIPLSYRVLHLACMRLFGPRGDATFLLGSLLLTFSSLHGYQDLLGGAMPYLFSGTVQPIAANMHAGYHYLWGIALATLGLAHLWTLRTERSALHWQLFVLCFCLGFGSAGIPVFWMAIGALMLLAAMLIGDKALLPLILRGLPLTAGIACAVLLPQVFNFFPRLLPQFAFSLPHWWYPRDITGVLEQTGQTWATAKSIALGPTLIVRGVGLFVAASLPLSLILCIRALRSNGPRSSVLALAVPVAAATLILTFTVSATSDWFSRGFIGTTVIGAFVTAHVLIRMRPRMVMTGFLGIVFALHVIPFFIDQHVRAVPHSSFSTIRKWNRQYPLGTVFFRRDYDTHAAAALYAGRMLITTPPAPLYAYFLHPDTYAAMGIPITFIPCTETWYARNTRDDRFIYPDDAGMTSVVPCAEAVFE